MDSARKVFVLFCISVGLVWLIPCAVPEQSKEGKLAPVVNVKTRCNAVGLNNVNIIWKPLQTSELSSNDVTSYEIFFCKLNGHLCNIITHPYCFGCKLNEASQNMSRKELHCNVGPSLQLHFPFEHTFYYFLQVTNSSGVYTSRRKICRVATNLKCTKPQNFTVRVQGSRNLTLSWTTPPYMGESTPLLCYRVIYNTTGYNINKTSSIEIADGSFMKTLQNLYSFTEYTFFIQCSQSDCINGWGEVAGPISAITEEEAPSESPVFDGWILATVHGNKRNIRISWELPSRETWNGILRKFEVFFWQVSSRENETTKPNTFKTLLVNEGSIRKATLTGLDRFSDYKTQISMCTSRGCGPRSDTMYIQAETVYRQAAENVGREAGSGPPVFVWIIVIVAPIVSILVVFGIVMRLYLKRRAQTNRQPPLREIIHLDEIQNYNDATDVISQRTVSYDKFQIHKGDNETSPIQDCSQSHLSDSL